MSIAEIRLHPWFTFTELPRFIDAKINKVFHKSEQEIFDKDIKEIMEVVKNLNFDLHGSDTLDKQIEDIKEHRDYSFVVGYHLIMNQQKIRKEKINQTKKKNQIEYVHLFKQIKKMFENKNMSLEEISSVVKKYTIEYDDCFTLNSWKIGKLLNSTIKKSIRKIINACNVIGVKIEKIIKESYIFKCNKASENGNQSNCFRFEISNSENGLVLDIINENIKNTDFLLICNQLLTLI